MNPVYLGVVHAVIIVALLFLWAVKDHVAGIDDLLLPVEIEVCPAGGDIEQLIVETSPGPVGGKPGPGEQMIDACTPYKEGVLSVFEISVKIVPVGIVCVHNICPPRKANKKNAQ